MAEQWGEQLNIDFPGQYHLCNVAHPDMWLVYIDLGLKLMPSRLASTSGLDIRSEWTVTRSGLDYTFALGDKYLSVQHMDIRLGQKDSKAKYILDGKKVQVGKEEELQILIRSNPYAPPIAYVDGKLCPWFYRQETTNNQLWVLKPITGEKEKQPVPPASAGKIDQPGNQGNTLPPSSESLDSSKRFETLLSTLKGLKIQEGNPGGPSTQGAVDQLIQGCEMIVGSAYKLFKENQDLRAALAEKK
ncbi:hypothetical protein BDV41DRAFT_49838 [Aspergillus transmontanensis]|uniref:Uncharacterized protein n=1 Tax=Aspergillus transmontanensis TaxID=1034304 RepID=A0A5N6VGM6_9EURO|nr:hypothetical protein BDV41DRAFT_49838 [Aspergillus transmontanensis]